MPTKINKAGTTYPIHQHELKHGVLYEGSDNTLYVGFGLKGILAVGINSNAYITSDLSGELIQFREVDAIINYQ